MRMLIIPWWRGQPVVERIQDLRGLHIGAVEVTWKNLQWVQDTVREPNGNPSSDGRHMRLRFHHVDCIGKKYSMSSTFPRAR